MKFARSLYIRMLMVLLFAVSLLPAMAQNTAGLAQAVGKLAQDKDMAHASLSVSVHDAATGAALYSHDGQRSLVPASLVKLFTTAAGFDVLGSAFRFTTTIGYVGNVDGNGMLHGNVYIIGGGDPLLGSYRFRQTLPDTVFAAWHKALQSHGIRSVNGRICYNASVFDRQYLPDSWQWGDIGNYYASGVSGLNFHENMFFIYFNAGTYLGFPATVASVSPASLDVNLQNEVMTGPENSGDQVIVYGEPSSTVRVARGTVPLGRKNFAIRAAMPRPARSCAELFAVYLRKQGCSVSHSVEEAYEQPKEMKEVLKYMNSPYYMVAQYTNQTSNNTYAECIYKYLGYQRYGLGSFVNGNKAVADFFKQQDLSDKGVRLADGSGLSRQNLCTTDFIARFLAKVHKMEIYNDFVQTLGVVGKSGTVRSMKLNAPAGTTVYGKSGSMEGVRSYAGYVVKENGKVYSYAIICNNYTGSNAQLRAKLETVLKEIATM